MKIAIILAVGRMMNQTRGAAKPIRGHAYAAPDAPMAQNILFSFRVAAGRTHPCVQERVARARWCPSIFFDCGAYLNSRTSTP
ncbi:hypothetical protein TNCV_4708661 [Trichonephila clavipes]|nr:hypothetical protein TNCV_4708661 [Trichonephila clavipes]